MPKLSYDHQRGQLILTRFLLILLPLLIALAAAAVAHFYTETKLLQVSQESDEVNRVALAQQGLVGEMRSVISDLTFLAKLNELWDLLDDRGPDSERARLMLAQEFLYFSENKGIYDQIAIVHIDGRELLRVNYGDGMPYVVEQAELAFQGGRNYFKEARELDLGGVYMSSFTLTREGQAADSPPRSVIRFATPLFDSDGEKAGLLFLSVRGETLLWGFRKAAAAIIDHAHLITNEGHALGYRAAAGGVRQVPYFDDTFVTSYPVEWARIAGEHSGSFTTENGLFTFTTVYPLVSVLEFYAQTSAGVVSDVNNDGAHAPARLWKIVAHIPAARRAIPYQRFFLENIWLYSFAALSVIVVSMLLTLVGVRRAVARAQADYEQRLRDTLGAIGFAAVTVDPSGRVLYCNEALRALAGWQDGEMLGRDWFDHAVPPAQRAGLRGDFEALMSGEAPLQATEYPLVTAAGEERLIAWNHVISFCPNGKVMTLTSIGHDITAQRANEEQLRKLSRAMEQTAESIIITDARGVMEYVNQGFVRLTGYRPEEAIGKRCNILKSGETTEDEYRALWQAINSGREWRGVFHNKRKDGRLYWENTVISPIRNEAGAITHFLAIKEDVTEHRRLREEVEQRNRELARAQSLAAMGQMASMVAHDLRNPLSSVKMTLQILKRRNRGDMGGEGGELSGIALDQIRYMERILADLLLFSRPDALKPQWLHVNKLLRDALETTREAIRARGARVKHRFRATLPAIHGDATKLQQVFTNLIMNALQAAADARARPVLTLKTYLDLSTPLPGVCIEISDNGAGVPPAVADKVFEPFFSTRAKGTGLGLAIVRRVVEEHRGSIHLLSGKGGGTVARVVLPTGQWRPQHSLPPRLQDTVHPSPPVAVNEN